MVTKFGTESRFANPLRTLKNEMAREFRMEGSLELAAKSIAPAILAILEQYPNAPAHLRRYHKICLNWIVREFPAPPTKVSVAAAAKARELGFPTLIGVEWRHQTKYDPKRKYLLWEHMLPVADIVQLLLELRQPNKELIADVLGRYQVAWITKTQNDKLPKKGRADPAAAYFAAGIELIDLY